MFWHHSTAIVDSGAQIGDGTKIWHFSHICAEDVRIGKNCSLGQNVYVGPRTRIGNGCRIQNNVSIYDLVELGDFVFCGPSMVFTNVVNPRSHISRKTEFKRTVVGRGTSFGANSTVVCGIEIGEFAFIAAGAVVTKNVLPFALMVGVPARHTGWMCQCGIQIVFEGKPTAQCPACKSTYTLAEGNCKATRLTGIWESL